MNSPYAVRPALLASVVTEQKKMLKSRFTCFSTSKRVRVCVRRIFGVKFAAKLAQVMFMKRPSLHIAPPNTTTHIGGMDASINCNATARDFLLQISTVLVRTQALFRVKKSSTSRACWSVVWRVRLSSPVCFHPMTDRNTNAFAETTKK